MRLASLLGLALLAALPDAGAGERLAYGPEPSQFGELWLPQGAAKPVPVVVLIHGGCWQAEYGYDLMDGLAQDLARQGVAVWNIEYRRLGETGGGYPGTFLDVAQAVDALRGIAQSHALDLAHLVTVGHSAGGHLTLWAAARARLPHDSALFAPSPVPVAAAVSLAGIADLEAYRRSGPACGGAATIDALVGAGQRAAANLFADTSPRALLPFGVRQLIVAGAADAIVPSRFARLYAYAAGAAGDRADFVEIPDSDHFALIDPASAGWSVLRGKILSLLR